ncbi:MAG TPA: response regulator transcription factor, partial [Ignavibacteria bacterium]|nr:response regulator transcription factor [Ignavibacteria bacterium]
PDAKIIILTMHNSFGYINKLFNIGVMGYIFKVCVPDELVKAIETVHFGTEYYCKAINRDELKRHSESYKLNRIADKDPKLTRREIDILLLMVQGCSNKEISKKLSISVRTVETHREHIQQKLNIKNLAKLTQYAYQKGYLELKSESF